jgi:hypothetical protein
MIKYIAFLFTATLISFNAAAIDTDLSGRYRVKGECAYQTENGEYKTCFAWNTLKLRFNNTIGEYAFTLDTNTFATTAGGCSISGTLRQVRENDKLYLKRSDKNMNTCSLRIQITKKHLILEAPENQTVASCRELCGYNSSLYSDPFPRKSRRK